MVKLWYCYGDVTIKYVCILLWCTRVIMSYDVNDCWCMWIWNIGYGICVYDYMIIYICIAILDAILNMNVLLPSGNLTKLWNITICRWENSLYVAIFNSNVKLPEGLYIYSQPWDVNVYLCYVCNFPRLAYRVLQCLVHIPHAKRALPTQMVY